MSEKPNLRFLLALGGQRVVVLRQRQQTQLYTNCSAQPKNISPARLYAAVQTK